MAKQFLDMFPGLWPYGLQNFLRGAGYGLEIPCEYCSTGDEISIYGKWPLNRGRTVRRLKTKEHKENAQKNVQK